LEYIEHLAEEFGLPNSTKDKAYLTKPIYVKLYEHLWDQDSHEYKHEGSRVDASTLLNIHCYSSARLQEVCGTRYKASL
jgi:L-lactate utilization protein LutC